MNSKLELMVKVVALGVLWSATQLPAQTVTNIWTGGGNGTSWSDAANWSSGAPQSNHVVRLGAATDDFGQPIADVAQAIDLDAADVEIWKLELLCEGNRELTLTSSIEAGLRIMISGPIHTTRAVQMLETAAARATVDVPLDIVKGSWSVLQNDSLDALLTIGPDHGVYDYGTGTAWRGGQGIIRLHRNTGTLNLETFDDPGVIGITIMDLSARGAGRALSPSPGADVRFADIADALLDLSLADGYTPDVDKTFTLLRADTTLSGATQGGSLFQYTDGYDEITVGSSLFRIDWAEGSEQIVLTVIPEPGSLLLMALAGAGLIALRRGQRRSH